MSIRLMFLLACCFLAWGIAAEARENAISPFRLKYKSSLMEKDDLKIHMDVFGPPGTGHFFLIEKDNGKTGLSAVTKAVDSKGQDLITKRTGLMLGVRTLLGRPLKHPPLSESRGPI